MTFLTFEVYKPKQRLLKEDTYQSKPQIAAHMIRELQMMGFKFKLVLADSLYKAIVTLLALRIATRLCGSNSE